jgi:hypothetical protein
MIRQGELCYPGEKSMTGKTFVEAKFVAVVAVVSLVTFVTIVSAASLVTSVNEGRKWHLSK